jgi:NAD(P)-dependent dehydrogenase (short-subunit alcohol dehydrogenase family)
MKRVLMTGVRRIGFNIAKKLIDNGYKVAFVYRTYTQAVEELLKENAFGIEGDLSDPNGYLKVVEKAVDYLNGIDAFIHGASPYFSTPIESLKRDELYAHFVPNTEAFLFLCKLLYPYMLQNSGDPKGRIVAFGDWAADTTPYRYYSAYFISKGALHTAVRVLAKEFAPYVLVNAIALGPTLKPDDFPDEKWEEYIKKTPLKRSVSLKDVVELTEFLLNAQSITGEVINLDSGRHISGEC